MTGAATRLVLIASVAAVQFGVQLCDHAFAQDAPRRYELAFEPRSKALKPTAENGTRLANAVDLLARHGGRRELGFRIVGAVPQSCLQTLDCAQAQLLRQRLQTLVLALQEKWPEPAGRAVVQDLLTWGGLPDAAPAIAGDPDRLMILLVVKPADSSRGCLQRAEVRDPALPGTVEQPDTAVWIAIAGERRIPVSSSAMLRVMDAARTVEVLSLAMSGDELRIPLPSRPSERSSLVSKDEDRAVGDMIRPWGSTSGPPAAEPAPDGCTLVFERWRVDGLR
jgi:hypothetical protein